MAEPTPTVQYKHCIIAKLPGGNFWSDKFDDRATMQAVLDWLKAHQIGDTFVTTDPFTQPVETNEQPT
jgi:hypothetical protein